MTPPRLRPPPRLAPSPPNPTPPPLSAAAAHSRRRLKLPLTPPLKTSQGALALTYKEQYKSPFLPVMPGHVLAEYNNLESAKAAIKKGKTAAVFVEPVQVCA